MKSAWKIYALAQHLLDMLQCDLLGAKVTVSPAGHLCHLWTSFSPTLPQDDISKIRETYDAFLAEFPLCYGYWKKYAEAENKHGHLSAALAVYERAVAATPYSSDLWGYYATFKQQMSDITPEDVRRQATAMPACRCASVPSFSAPSAPQHPFSSAFRGLLAADMPLGSAFPISQPLQKSAAPPLM